MNDTRKIENLHVALWLMKDVSWCSDWKILGLVMVVPTLAVAMRICWDTRHRLADLIHNMAVCLWICANTVWMIGEFFFDDGTRAIAKVFFFSGMALLTVYYVWAWTARNRDDAPGALG
ncbi:MAG: hypothetical protein ABI811_19620 [Acidobacteriota bacterium]